MAHSLHSLITKGGGGGGGEAMLNLIYGGFVIVHLESSFSHFLSFLIGPVLE
jgi:hypothetical protein